MPHYRIRQGESFRDSDGTIKTGGHTIELPDDMAALHLDKVKPLPPSPQADPMPATGSAE